MATKSLTELGLSSADLSAIGKLSEKGLSPDKIANAIEKIHNVSSSASEIDNSVNSILNVKDFGAMGDGVNDDSAAIQSAIDYANTYYLSQTERMQNGIKIFIPYGNYKVENIHIKSGISFGMQGTFIPLNQNSNCVYISGSYINIGSIKASARYTTNYTGKLISFDSSNQTTIEHLANKSKLAKMSFINIDTLDLMGDNSSSGTCLYFNSDNVARGIAWINIRNTNIANMDTGININATGTGYVNSIKIDAFIGSCNKSLLINTNGTGEISQNSYDVRIQPRDANSVIGISNIGGTSSSFDGTIWDWKETYGLAIFDTGEYNTYSKSIYPEFWAHKTRFVNQSNTVNDALGVKSNFNTIYESNETTHNALGWQDNLLMFADRLFTTTVTPSKSSTFSKAFQLPSGINHAWYTTWTNPDGTGEIQLTITDIPAFRFYGINIGFQLKTRIAKSVKIEYKYNTGAWTEVLNMTDNLSTNVNYRTNGGSGLDATSLRFTFNNGANVTDVNNVALPSSNILAIQSIAVFGAGQRNAFMQVGQSGVITPEMFGAKGDGVTDDTAALTLALAKTNKYVVLRGNGKYRCANLVLNADANIDLFLGNLNNTDPIICLNGPDINLNNTVIDINGPSYTGNVIECDDTKPWFTTNSVARLRADCLQVFNWTGTSVTHGQAVGFYVNSTTQKYLSYWDIKLFRTQATKSGLVVYTSGTGYFTSNIFHRIQIVNFIDKPIYLESSVNAEISANTFTMDIQPSTDTLDGVKILGGRYTKRNVFDGEVWDWHKAPVGTKPIEDKGWYTQLRHMDSSLINANQTTIDVGGIGYSVIPGKELNIPTNAQGKSLSGHLDNYLAYCNLRTGFVITKSHEFNSGSDSLLFSLDTYNSTSWTGLTPSDVRTMEITFPEPITADSVFISFQLGGVPKNVKIEFYGGSTPAWVTRVDKVNNVDTLVGKRGSTTSFYTGLTNTTKMRITVSDPYTYTDASNALGWVATDRISIANIYLASNQHKLKAPYVDVSTPILLGDLRSSKSVTQDISNMSQTKCLKLRDENGVLVGYLPIYS